MTAQPDFKFDDKRGEVLNGGIMVALCRLHAQIFDAYLKAQGPITVLKIADAIGYPRHVIDAEIPKMLRRLKPLCITLGNGGSQGRWIVFEDPPKWKPNIPPPVRLEGEGPSR